MSLILIHGLGQTKDSWKDVKASLQTSDILCLELPQNRPMGKLDYAVLYDDLKEACQNHSEKADLVGLSLGGVLALNYALDYPDKVRSLVLINSQYKMPKLILTLQNIFFRFLPEKMFAGAGFSKKEMISLCHSMKNLDFSQKLNNIKCPVLIVSGEKDRLNRKASESLASLLGNAARFEIVAGDGHAINQEQPKLLADLINAFCRGLL